MADQKNQVFAIVRIEPPRDCRRLPTVSDWEHDEAEAILP